MNYFAGLDIGSTAIKVALVDEDGKIVGVHVSSSGSLFHKNAKEALQNLLAQLNVDQNDVRYLIATGYGRKLFKEADDSISEITANAIGAFEAGKAFGGVRTIINIGGQDSKAIQIDDTGNVSNFAMNDKCAAGTGRFLGSAAEALMLSLDDIGDISLKAKNPVRLTTVCTVFVESDIMSYLAQNKKVEDILGGVHSAIAARTISLVRRVGIEPEVTFTGGVSLNIGMVRALEEKLGLKLNVSPDSHYVGALGASIFALERALAGASSGTHEATGAGAGSST